MREMADEHAEARWVTAEIERLVDEGVSRSEIAIFYRTNAQSRVLEDMLVRAQVAYQVIGGTKFYERAEIKDAVAYLTFLVNPQDGAAFTRIANSPRRGLGQTSMSRVLAHAERWGSRCGRPRRARSPGSRPRRARRSGASWRRCAAARAGGAGRAGGAVARRDAGRDRLPRRAQAERTIEAQGRIENLEELVRGRAGVRRQRARGGGSLGEFLQQIALLADADGIRDDEGLVTLMTLHNAKGLEFPIVFIIGMEDGVFPHSRAIEEGNDRGGAAARVRRPDARDARPHAHVRAPAEHVRRRGGPEHPLALPRRVAARADRPGGADRARVPGAGADRVVGGRGRRGRRGRGGAGGAVFRVGDDVVHAKLGEGVVTGVEPGGIVVVRFAGESGPQADGRLRADPQPLRFEPLGWG